jgi:hypothetical protein
LENAQTERDAADYREPTKITFYYALEDMMPDDFPLPVKMKETYMPWIMREYAWQL